jgi:IS4 transposase
MTDLCDREHVYFAFACLLYSIWRAVDLLVQVELTGEYEHAPVVTADNTSRCSRKRRESAKEAPYSA